MLDNNLDPSGDSWKVDAVSELGDAMVRMASLEDQQAQGSYVSEESMTEASDTLALAQYRLEHEISSYMTERRKNQQSVLERSFGRRYASHLYKRGHDRDRRRIRRKWIFSGRSNSCLINPVKRSRIIISKFLSLYAALRGHDPGKSLW